MIPPTGDLFRQNPRHVFDVCGIDAMELKKLIEIIAVGDLRFLGLGFSEPRLLGFLDNVPQLEHVARHFAAEYGRDVVRRGGQFIGHDCRSLVGQS